MLYARSDTDLASMVECLVEELAAVGLNLNTSKTKILTSLKEPIFLAIGGDRIEVLHGEQNHKIWRPSENGHGGYTTSESNRLDEI